MKYINFCFVLLKGEEIALPADFVHAGAKRYYKGDAAAEVLLGNVSPYLPEHQALSKNDLAKLLLTECAHNPTQFLKDFVADFSFVLSPSNGFLFAVRDHMGIFPLYYYNDDKVLLIANDQRLMLDVPGLDLKPDAQWMGEYIQGNNSSNENTFYEKIKKVPAAHYLQFVDGEVHVERYWDLDFNRKMEAKSDAAYIAEFRALLQEAVLSRIPGEGALGCEISGGIDCTSIAMIAKEYLNQHQRALYTYAHSAVDYAQYPGERAAIDKFRTYLQPTKHCFVPEKVEGMKVIEEHAFELRNGLPKAHYAKFSRGIYAAAQRDGVQVLLSGNGGDHCVSFKDSRMVLQEQILKMQWQRVFKELWLRHRNPFKVLWKFTTCALNIVIPAPSAKKNAAMEQSKTQGLTFMRQHFPELNNYRDVSTKEKHKFRPFAEVSRRLLFNGDIADRGEACTIAAQHFGVLYRYPLLDIRLLQMMVTLPAHMIYQNNQNRYIFREAIKAWVPLYLAEQPKLPADMYGWLKEAHTFDIAHKTTYIREYKDVEQRFYALYATRFDAMRKK